jgi:hypothetical protein
MPKHALSLVAALGGVPPAALLDCIDVISPTMSKEAGKSKHI